jgi:hypothetical protein
LQEVLPAGTAALLEDQQLGGIARARERREGRTRDADGAVASVRVEGVLRPAVADVGRRDRRELAEVLVDPDFLELEVGLLGETEGALATQQ